MCRLVRVYLSSTYTDMTMEKTEIFNEICPQLKRFCMQDNFVLQIYSRKAREESVGKGVG
jgi:hypothetical protein